MIYSIEVPCKKNNLKKVRQFVERVLTAYLISPTETNMMVLAIDELCANLMIHSHACNPKNHIEVRILQSHNQQFIFEIHDQAGDSFNLLEYQAPDMQEVIRQRRSGGIGLILVKKIMDDIQVERKGEHNICRLYKSISAPST